MARRLFNWFEARGSPLPLPLSQPPSLSRETGACLDVAMALGYVESVDAVLLTRLDEVRAVLAKVVR